jgi:type II secretory pathway pseudopilin PulG
MSVRSSHTHHSLSHLEIALLLSVVGVAVAIAVPELMQIERDTNDDSAKTRLVNAGRALENRHSAAGTFAGAALPAGVRLHTASGSYCVETTVDSRVWHQARNAKPTSGACPRP